MGVGVGGGLKTQWHGGTKRRRIGENGRRGAGAVDSEGAREDVSKGEQRTDWAMGTRQWPRSSDVRIWRLSAHGPWMGQSWPGGAEPTPSCRRVEGGRGPGTRLRLGLMRAQGFESRRMQSRCSADVANAKFIVIRNNERKNRPRRHARRTSAPTPCQPWPRPPSTCF